MSLISAFSKLYLRNVSAATRSVSTTTSLLFRATPILCAEPLKKKKRLDPQIIRNREERKKKRIEKQIRRLEKNARQLKPIDELEVPLSLIDEKEKRTRTNLQITPEILESRAVLEKSWARYKLQENLADFKLIDRVVMAQEKALQELRYESEELYQEAIQPDMQLLPFSARGPVSTPPIDSYESPDGEFNNTSKKWD